MSFEEKRYMIDNEPASADDIINHAKALDKNFGESGLLTTSQAARILREHGHTVSNNTNFTKT